MVLTAAHGWVGVQLGSSFGLLLAPGHHGVVQLGLLLLTVYLA